MLTDLSQQGSPLSYYINHFVSVGELRSSLYGLLLVRLQFQSYRSFLQCSFGALFLEGVNEGQIIDRSEYFLLLENSNQQV